MQFNRHLRTDGGPSGGRPAHSRYVVFGVLLEFVQATAGESAPSDTHMGLTSFRSRSTLTPTPADRGAVQDE
ncbi:MAG: hypothetical protein MHM6MM_004259 [Cercozoa sp. M6MM]